MKNLASALALMAGVAAAAAQTVFHNPGTVSFQNTEAARPAGRPVTFHLIYDNQFALQPTPGAPLVGTQYKAELYYLDTITSSLVPLPLSVSSFKASTSSSPGTWNGPSFNVPLPPGLGGIDVFDDDSGEAGDGTGTGFGYYPVTLCARVWDATAGPTWKPHI